MTVEYASVDFFDLITEQIEGNLLYEEENCQTASGDFSHLPSSLMVRTANQAQAVCGLRPKSTVYPGISGNITYGERPLIQTRITLGRQAGEWPDRFFVGFMDESPDTDDPAAHKEIRRGGWRNAALACSCGFWYQEGDFGDMWCCVHQRGSSWLRYVTSKSALPDAGETAKKFELRCNLGQDRCPRWWIDGDFVHQGTFPLSLTGNAKPYLLVVGDEVVIYCHSLGVLKR